MNTIESLETLEIPLNKLLSWNDNVRTTAAEEAIGELAASIASVGLLQGLVVVKQSRGKYTVIAGRRRLLALSRLAADGTVKQTWPVPCRVAPKEADLPEISLTENVVRVPMHPADEFEAFQRLISAGKSVIDVAARFGVTEAVVNRRLVLARVSPPLLAQYREGKLTLELLQAFTLTDDHAVQEAVWEQLQPWDRKPQTIRRMLSHDEIPVTDKQVRFVGLKKYEVEGGAIRRDLFADDEGGTYIADPAKLTRLVSTKLQSIADDLQAEGWKWVTVQPEIDQMFVNRHRRMNAPLLPLNAEAEAELQALEAECDSIAERFNEELSEEDECDEDTSDDAMQEPMQELEEKIRAIRATRKRDYSTEVKASCGVVVGVGHNGQPEFIYGLLRKEDESALMEADESRDGVGPKPALDEIAEESPAYSAALIESLTQYKTAAIAVELAQQPSIALAALIHSLILNEFGLDLHFYGAKSSLQVSSCQADLAGASGSSALALLDQMKIDWAKQFPATPTALWAWCLEQPQGKLLEMLAYCIARTLHGVQFKTDSNPARLQHVDALACALGCDMRKWFTPTAENFFLRVPKSKIADALAEAGKPLTMNGLKRKKVELAAQAEAQLAGTGWLPEQVRIAAQVDAPQASMEA